MPRRAVPKSGVAREGPAFIPRTRAGPYSRAKAPPREIGQAIKVRGAATARLTTM
jgi:hypothetical protein